MLTTDNLRKQSICMFWIGVACVHIIQNLPIKKKKSNGESVNRLLFHCPVAMKLWCIVDLIASWQGRFVHHQNDVIWKAVPHCLMWVFGERGISKALRILKDLCLVLNYFSLEFCWIGCQLWVVILYV